MQNRSFRFTRWSKWRWRGLGDNRFLGSDNFTAIVLRQAEARPLAKPDLESVKRAVADAYGIAVEDLAAPGRGMGYPNNTKDKID